jgi:hypothetical protein
MAAPRIKAPVTAARAAVSAIQSRLPADEQEPSPGRTRRSGFTLTRNSSGAARGSEERRCLRASTG